MDFIVFFLSIILLLACWYFYYFSENILSVIGEYIHMMPATYGKIVAVLQLRLQMKYHDK